MPISGEADEDEPGSGRSTHKSIPSWSEAIGVMVDSVHHAVEGFLEGLDNVNLNRHSAAKSSKH